MKISEQIGFYLDSFFQISMETEFLKKLQREEKENDKRKSKFTFEVKQ